MQRLTVAPSQIQAQRLILTPEQYHYLRRVLRLGVGDRFVAIDGAGRAWEASLLDAEAQIITAIDLPTRELPVTVHLAIAMPKGNGLDDVVRACTELGAHHFHPVTSDRTLLQPSTSRQQRWQKIAQEATEQCERAVTPQVHPALPWREVMAQAQGCRYLCVTRHPAPSLFGALRGLELAALGDLWLAIGPEGGWSDREVAQGVNLGWQTISLGPRILRTITAPVAAMAALGAFWEENIFNIT